MLYFDPNSYLMFISSSVNDVKILISNFQIDREKEVKRHKNGIPKHSTNINGAKK